MGLIIFAFFLSLLQNGFTQYQQYIIQPEIVERRNPVYIPETPITQMKFHTPTTIITDCTPSVCHNLGNLVQLMIVSDLLRNTNIGSTAALKMALPVIREALSSPSLANICPESLKQKFNLLSSRIPNTNIVQSIGPNIAAPNLEFSPNLFIPKDLLTAAPVLSSTNLVYQNLPLPVNAVTNLPLDIIESRAISSLPPNMAYQNIPVNTVSNNLPLNVALQNIIPLPVDILEPKVVPSSLPHNVIYQSLPPSLNTIFNNIPLNTLLQNLPADIQGSPAKIVFRSSPYERTDPTPNFVFRNAPKGNLNTISTSFPLKISPPNTRPIKFLIRS